MQFFNEAFIFIRIPYWYYRYNKNKVKNLKKIYNRFYCERWLEGEGVGFYTLTIFAAKLIEQSYFALAIKQEILQTGVLNND